MLHLKLTRWSGLLITLLLFASPVAAQQPVPCPTPVTIDAWFNCMVAHVAAPILNQRENTKQVELPSIAEDTTSLVDQTAAPDLVGLALNLAGINNDSNDKATSGSITTSAYALFAAAKQQDPLNPAFYSKYPNLRRFSFTYGQSDEEKESRATLLGAKILIINGRDASRADNQVKLANVSKDLRAASADFAAIALEIEDYLYEQLAPSGKDKATFLNQDLNGAQLQPTLSRLTPQQLDEIKSIIARRIQSHVALVQGTERAYEEIKRAPQLSFTFQSKLRDELGADEYRTGLLFDYGIYQQINLTLSGTFDYKNTRIVGGDKRGGRFAAETTFQLTPEDFFLGADRPFLFSIAGSGEWLTQTRPKYIGQAKFTIPIFNGISFPISVSVANQSSLIKESTVKGRFGFTFDLAKLLSRPR